MVLAVLMGGAIRGRQDLAPDPLDEAIEVPIILEDHERAEDSPVSFLDEFYDAPFQVLCDT